MVSVMTAHRAVYVVVSRCSKGGQPCDVSRCIAQVARSGTGAYLIYQHDRLFSQPSVHTPDQARVAEAKLCGRSPGKGKKRWSEQGQAYGSAAEIYNY
ncbi:uncharacterized protein MYCFIDRAFT_178664 [Pseudocercospora fijiensis CIRAD86]|uniref:Uncharacterized protein n=1 Tax=Pseudocercospora fijiensis (strain CIRAD86) TaxID=383855 RepID=M2ZHB3_PSEFD|nr:uncharacterized protein MYCFIDRAFT_178664 [Pseudocercospora fijiensis CIRAD86]EME78529.1 hypothetical protein MYCFIDRAFT_178664 [Pseudocercospora fijiensis CIRAD86]